MGGGAFHVGRAAQPDGPLPGLFNSAGAWADINNDGRMDVLLMGATTEETITRLYRNNGDGTFHDVGATLRPMAQGFATWGDYDNDGDLDLAIAGQDYLGQPSAKIYRNDGNNIFTDLHAALTGDLPVYMSWVDFDHDGDLDLYLAGQIVARLYRNDAAIFVPQRTHPSLGIGVWGDFDGDGMLDLFGSGVTYLHRGNGKFEVLTSAYLPSLGSSTTDDDGDGRLDVLAGNAILRNLGTGEFLPEPQESLPTSWVARWGDFDRDGVSDLLLAISEPGPPAMEVHRRTATGWQRIVVVPGIYCPGVSCVDWVDIDNDGDLDVFYTGVVSGFYTNTTPHSDAKPGPPPKLRTKELSVYGANGVLLSWDPPTNSSGRLSYNLRVGFQAGGGDVMTTHSDPVTGHRWLYAPGNAGFQTNHLLRPRRAGTYHWSVQAIANDFSASTFSQEMTFTITNSPPTISGFSDQMMVANTELNLGPIPFAIEDGESPGSALTLSATSSNTNLIPNESIQFMVGPNGPTLSARPVRFQTGATTMSVRVTDPEGAFSESYFDVTVQPLFVLTEETILASALPFGGWGDFDRDGDLDLLLGGGPVAIYRNDGHPGLAKTGAPIIGEWEGTPRTLGRGALAWSDADNDGDLDLLAIGQTSGNPPNVADIFHNNGDGTFFAANTGIPLLTENPFGSWADFDCDGRMDVLVGGRLSQVGFVTQLFRNNGPGSYTFFEKVPRSPDAVIVIRPTAAWMDFDNDGDPDLLTCGAGRSQLLRNDGPQASLILEWPCPA